MQENICMHLRFKETIKVSNQMQLLTNNFLADYSKHNNNIYSICIYNNNEFRNLFHK